MTELDKALEIFRQDIEDPKNQSQFYDLFLNSTLYLPTTPEEVSEGDEQPAGKGQGLPLILEAEGNDYLVFFDTEERLRNWAREEVTFVAVPGHVIAEMSEAPLHWALNVGAELSKQFVPEEIAYLKEAVRRCNLEAAKNRE